MRSLANRRGAARPTWAVAAGAWVLLLTAAMVWHEPPLGRLAGRVTNTLGRPQPGLDILCRGLSGAAAGQVWLGVSRDDGSFEVTLPTGEVEVEASRHDTRTAPVQVTVRDGRTHRLELSVPAGLCWIDPWLNVFMPERVFRTTEAPSVGVEGRGAGLDHRVEVAVDQVALARVLAERGGWPWFEAWQGTVGPTALRNLAPYLTRVGHWTLPLAQRGPLSAGEFLRYAELPRLPAGSYLVQLRIGGESVQLAFTVTDLALVAKSDGRRLLAHVCDVTSGAPRPGARVSVHDPDSAQPPLVRTTDASGLASFSLPRVASLLVLARRDGQEALVTIAGGASEEDSRVIRLSTDRPIYRPGHRVYLKGLVRDRTPSGYRVPPPQPVRLTVSDGRGHEVARLTARTSAFGSFDTEFAIPEEAATGQFSLEAEVGGQRGSGSFPVKAYVKPAFSIALQAPAQPLDPDARVEVSAAATYYFGAPVAGGRLRYTVRREESWWQPPDPSSPEAERLEDWEKALYPAFQHEEASGEQVAAGTLRLDASGQAVISLPAAALLPPLPQPEARTPAGQPLVPAVTRPTGIDLAVEVTDGTGRLEEAVATVTILPVDRFVRLETARSWLGYHDAAELTVAVTNRAGAPAAGRRVGIDSYLRRYVAAVPGGPVTEVIWRGPTVAVTTDARGRAQTRVDPPAPGEWIFVAHTTDTTGRPVITHQEVWVSAEDGSLPVGGGEEGSALELVAEREHYRAGQTAALRVRASGHGPLLLTHEGEALREARLLTVRGGSAAGSIALTEADIPQTTVVATQVRDKQLQTAELDLGVELRPKVLEVTVTPSVATATPRQGVTFTITATRGGQPVDAEVALAVVDESIFAMAEEHPEEAVLAFYGQRWNRVMTAFSAEPYYYTGTKGGSGQIRREFPDTAGWYPSLRTGPDGVVMVGLQLPDSLTTWRASAIAHTQATEIGFGRAKVVVRQPLMARLELPRFLTMGDQSTVVAGVHNESGAPQQVTVELHAPQVRIAGARTRQVRVRAGGRATVAWPVTATQPGPATFRVSVTAGHWRDALQRTLGVQPFARLQRVVQRGELRDGRLSMTLTAPIDTVVAAARLRLTVSPSPGVAVFEAVERLADYPYGCVEQTTSRFLGSLAAAEAAQLLGWPTNGLLSAPSLRQLTTSGLIRLRRLQHYDGAWGWWEGGEPDPAMTAYALLGLLTARAKQQAVDDAVVASGLDWLASQVIERKPHLPHDDLGLALYVLALGGRPVHGEAIDRLYWSKQPLTAAGAALGVLAARESGQTEAGRRSARLLGMLLSEARPERASVADLSWALRAELATSGLTSRADVLAEALNARYDGDGWASTWDTALAVGALCEYLAARQHQPTRGVLSATVNGQAQPEYRFAADTARGLGARYRMTGGAVRAGDNHVELRLDGQGAPPVLAVLEAPVAIRGQARPAPSADLAVSRTYRRLRALPAGGFGRTSLNGRCRVDDIIEVELLVKARLDEEYLLLEDPLPAGFEVLDRGEVLDRQGLGAELDDAWVARDVRDDRVAFFATRVAAGESYRVRYLLRAAVPGRYQVLPTRVEPMYHPAAGGSGDSAVIGVEP